MEILFRRKILGEEILFNFHITYYWHTVKLEKCIVKTSDPEIFSITWYFFSQM